MGYLDIMDFDFGSLINFLKTVGTKIIQAPMKLLGKLPDWFKIVFFILILAASVAIARWWWKNREEWRKYKRI